MSGCRFPEHHRGGSSGFPWPLAVVVAGLVIAVTSETFAHIMHTVMVLVLGVCAVVAVSGLTGLALVLHHQRAMRERAVEARRPIHLTARLERRPGVEDAPRQAVTGPSRPRARPQARRALEERRPW